MKFSTDILISEPVQYLVDGREWKPWKRFHWIEKIVRRWWQRLSRECVRTRPCYRTVSIEHDRLVGLCREAIQQFRRIDDIPRHVVMGPKQYGMAMEDVLASPISVGVRIPLDIRGFSTIMGMTIHIVPWFDGILLLPDLQAKESAHG